MAGHFRKVLAMNMRLVESQLPSLHREKQPRKYMGFALQPRDEGLLALLPDKQREILLSKGKYREQAATFGVAVGTIRSRLHRARAALSALRQSSSEHHLKAPCETIEQSTCAVAGQCLI